MLENCPRCKGTSKVKDGVIKGKQRYKCKECNFRYTSEDKTEKRNALKRQSLELYLEGLGFRSIGRFLKISHVSVYNWIKSYGEKIDNLRKKESSKIVEIDELHTYVGSKKTTAGYGLLLIELGGNTLISYLDAEEKKQEKSFIKQ